MNDRKRQKRRAEIMLRKSSESKWWTKQAEAFLEEFAEGLQNTSTTLALLADGVAEIGRTMKGWWQLYEQ